MSWQKVYDLRDDQQFVDLVQKATLTTKEFGLEPTHGLFGSPAWWRQVDNGALPTHTLRGVITRVYMGSMNDWPEFEMKAEHGSIHQFTRHQTPPDGALDHLYKAGRKIDVDFVWQEFRRGAPNYGLPNPGKTVTAVRINA